MNTPLMFNMQLGVCKLCALVFLILRHFKLKAPFMPALKPPTLSLNEGIS